MALAALVYGLYMVTRTIFFGTDFPGFPSIMVAISFLGGLQMIGLGILGEYVVRILIETKRRPLYLVRMC